MNAPVRETVSVIVSEPVSGKRRRRARTERRGRSSKVETVTVDKRVLARAHEVLRPGERLRIVDETTIVTVYEWR